MHSGSPILNAFTVDVEDYFQVSALKDRVSLADWDKCESRVEANTEKILGILDQHHVRGTFFILGWVADRYPGLVQRIQYAGHEIASHGYWHQLIYNQSPDEFAADIAKSKDAISSVTGQAVTAYRAPSFSIVKRSLWALDVLSEQGITLDSSVFPISGHDLYGIPGARQEIHELPTRHGKIIEFPPSAAKLGKISIPIGGGYFRLLPFSVTAHAIKSVQLQGRPVMFYIHPWEFDPQQPRFDQLKWKSRVRHYTGLHKTEKNISRMLKRFSWGAIEDVVHQTLVSRDA
jgi:polysaccharide deacetylase family protein (PEP-CTERM system associated)